MCDWPIKLIECFSLTILIFRFNAAYNLYGLAFRQMDGRMDENVCAFGNGHCLWLITWHVEHASMGDVSNESTDNGCG